MSRSSIPEGPESERRTASRYPVEWPVDCRAEETFLYAEITNVSDMGIFVSCAEPFEVGTLLTLRFRPGDTHPSFTLPGQVQWVNRSKTFAPSRHPGMGILFTELSADERERIVEVVHTIAYLRNLSN